MLSPDLTCGRGIFAVWNDDRVPSNDFLRSPGTSLLRNGAAGHGECFTKHKPVIVSVPFVATTRDGRGASGGRGLSVHRRG